MTDQMVGAPSLSVIETEILMQLATSTSRSSVADSLGLPVTVIAELLRRKGVREWLAELKSARRDQMLTYATEVVAATLRDKMDIITNDDDKRLGTSTRKDHIELAKTLTDMLKGQSTIEEQSNNPLAKIYQQINILQSTPPTSPQIVIEDT